MFFLEEYWRYKEIDEKNNKEYYYPNSFTPGPGNRPFTVDSAFSVADHFCFCNDCRGLRSTAVIFFLAVTCGDCSNFDT